jgi:hypothetical protein
VIAWLSAALRSLAGTVPLDPIKDPLDPPDPVNPGEIALAEARRLCALDIVDPSPTDRSANAERCRALIQTFIRAALPNHVYRGNGQGAEWCLLFWFYCWRDLIDLTPAERACYLPSTYRIHELLNHRSIFGVPCPKHRWRRWTFTASATALPAGCVPQDGDLLIVGDGQPDYGDHATMVRGWDAVRRVFHTVEGNATERLGNGKRRQGVILAERPLGKRDGQTYYAIALIRPAPADIG